MHTEVCQVKLYDGISFKIFQQIKQPNIVLRPKDVLQKCFYSSVHLRNTKYPVSLQRDSEWTLEIIVLKSPAIKGKITCFTSVSLDFATYLNIELFLHNIY